MKTAVIGSGKTGQHVVDLLEEAGQLQAVYNRRHPATPKKLAEADVCIVFTPGEAVPELVPVVLDSGVPCAWGSTGCQWDPIWDRQVKEKGQCWVHASNFSLGMVVIRKMLETLKASSQVLANASYQIHELHHSKKKDGPSGTALSWEDYLGDVQGEKLPTTFDRVGDEIGTHRLSITTPWEQMTVEHRSLDRRLFAQGAIWVAERLYHQDFKTPGLHPFETLVDSLFTISL